MELVEIRVYVPVAMALDKSAKQASFEGVERIEPARERLVRVAMDVGRNAHSDCAISPEIDHLQGRSDFDLGVSPAFEFVLAHDKAANQIAIRKQEVDRFIFIKLFNAVHNGQC